MLCTVQLTVCPVIQKYTGTLIITPVTSFRQLSVCVVSHPDTIQLTVTPVVLFFKYTISEVSFNEFFALFSADTVHPLTYGTIFLPHYLPECKAIIFRIFT